MEQKVTDDRPEFPFPVDASAAALVEHWRRLRSGHGVAQLTLGAEGNGTAIEVVTVRDDLTVQLHGVTAKVEQGTLQSATTLFPGSVEHADATEAVRPPEVAPAFAVYGDAVEEGDVILMVTPAWLRIVGELERDPDALLRLTWRQGEELVASAYREDPEYGLESDVILTPGSGDGARDIIVTRRGAGRCAIRWRCKRRGPHAAQASDQDRRRVI